MPSRYKVLHVIETLGRGGAEHVLLNLLPALRENGHQPEVAVLFPPYDLQPALEERGISVHRLGLQHRGDILTAWRSLRELILHKKYDIVQSHLFFAGLYTALVLPNTAIPRRIETFHNLAYDAYPAVSLWKKTRKTVHRYILHKRVHGFTAVSNAVAQSYKTHLKLSDIQVIANPFTETIIEETRVADRYQTREWLQIESDCLLILLAGRFSKEKGHRFALESFAQLLAKGTVKQHSIKLLMVGSGPLKLELEALAESLNIQSDVRFSPTVENDKFLRIVAASDIVIMPSLHEGFPVVALEAMALGKPLIASAVGGLKEMIQSGVSGILIPAFDSTALAQAVEALCMDAELRQRLGEAARQYAYKNYSSKVIAALWDSFYTALWSPISDKHFATHITSKHNS